MKKPAPVKNGECEQCHRIVRLTMPIGWIPGWPIVVWTQLCTTCRCSQQLSQHWHTYGVPAYLFENSRSEATRRTYAEWLACETLEPKPAEYFDSTPLGEPLTLKEQT